MKTAMQITELDRVTLVSFVKRIRIYEDKRVYLELRYKELFSKVIMLADYLESGKQLRKGGKPATLACVNGKNL